MASQCGWLALRRTTAGVGGAMKKNWEMSVNWYTAPMALKSTIFKADVQIADMDRHYYQDHALTIARHPSETDERMMMRVLAFARHAGDALFFGKGLSSD